MKYLGYTPLEVLQALTIAVVVSMPMWLGILLDGGI